MRRRAAVLGSLALMLFGATGIAACGGADRQSSALLERALARPVASADVVVDLRVDADGAPGVEEPLRLRLSGPYRSGGGRRLPSFDWDLAFSGMGQNVSAGLVSTGDNAFVTFLGSAYEVGERKVARHNRRLARSARDRSRGSLEDLGVDPRGWIRRAESEGDDTVAGVETTHLSGQIDVPRMLADLDQAKRGSRRGERHEFTQAERRRLAESVEGNRFEVWVAKGDETIRRLTAEVDLKAPAGRRPAPRPRDRGGPLAALAGAERAHIELSIELSDVGGEQRIQAPANPRPLAELGRALEGMGRRGAMGGPGGPTAGAAGNLTGPQLLVVD